MAEKVGKEQIKREKGYLYYLGKDGYLWKTPTKLNKSGTQGEGRDREDRPRGRVHVLPRQEGLHLPRPHEERVTRPNLSQPNPSGVFPPEGFSLATFPDPPIDSRSRPAHRVGGIGLP